MCTKDLKGLNELNEKIQFCSYKPEKFQMVNENILNHCVDDNFLDLLKKVKILMNNQSVDGSVVVVRS